MTLEILPELRAALAEADGRDSPAGRDAELRRTAGRVGALGQDRAKRILAVAVVNHYKRILASENFHIDDEYKDVNIEKSNQK